MWRRIHTPLESSVVGQTEDTSTAPHAHLSQYSHLQADAPPPHVRVRTLHVSFSALFLLLNLIRPHPCNGWSLFSINKSPT